MSTYDRWKTAWQDVGLEAPGREVYGVLVTRYEESHRAYHTLQHVDECLAWFDQVRSSLEKPAEVELAIWYHDAVYDTHRSDNEEQSASLAVETLRSQGGPDDLGRCVYQLILATRHDSPVHDADSTMLVDIDLAILGAPQPRFDQYERQIRTEYAWVPVEAYREGRAKVLRGFLAREAIYVNREFQPLETRARANLTRSLAALAKGDC